MTANMRIEVIWAIRDCHSLKAPEKALLYAVESRGQAYGKWQTTAADAGMKRDAYYNTRNRLEERGVLTVTRRAGSTTILSVNAEWFASSGMSNEQNIPSGEDVTHPSGIPNNPSGSFGMKEDLEGDPLRGPLKRPILKRVSDFPDYTPGEIRTISAGIWEE